MWLATPDQRPLSSNRTSLLYDPPDGQLPAQTPDARQRAAARRAIAGFDRYENRCKSSRRRTISWCTGSWPPRHGSFQPTGGQHISERLRLWAGDSSGRWEGDTFVVDTTNFTDRTAFQGSSSALHVVERFTRVSADKIVFQLTVDDPRTWSRPWSAEVPMLATKGPLFEYACHEGNYGLPNILSGARYSEKNTRKEQ